MCLHLFKILVQNMLPGIVVFCVSLLSLHHGKNTVFFQASKVHVNVPANITSVQLGASLLIFNSTAYKTQPLTCNLEPICLPCLLFLTWPQPASCCQSNADADIPLQPVEIKTFLLLISLKQSLFLTAKRNNQL